MVEFYHEQLSSLLSKQGDTPPSLDELKISIELALCDWRRFSEVGLGGWGHSSANQRVIHILDQLDGGSMLQSEQAYIDAVQVHFPLPR